jgi:transposase
VTRDEFSADELQRLAAATKDAGYCRRLQSISLVMQGWSREKAAAFADVDRQTLRDWVERYNDGGPDALKTLTSPGRRRRLTPRQAEELSEIVKKGPDLEKHGVVRWRCEDLVKVLAERFDVKDVHPSTVGKWLHKLGLSKLSARPHHPQKDEAAQEAFKAGFKDKVTTALPAEVKVELAKKTLSLEIWLQDEARVGQQGTLTRVWAERGSRPSMVRDNRRQSVYLYGAICPARGVAAAIVMPGVDTSSMNEHLSQISLTIAPKAHAVLICDGAGWHEKSKDLVVPHNITLLTLPPYSPELNTMENIWAFLRGNRLCGKIWKTSSDIMDACADAWNWLVSQPERITSIGTREWMVV